MSGHGHVIPRADGTKARCGGPRICKECAVEASRVRLEQSPAAAQQARIEQLEAFVAEVAGGMCLWSNAGCHPNHPQGQCRVCRARALLGLPQDADGTIRQARST